MNHPKRIGLTGPTGSGKSTVASMMAQWGDVAFIDADVVAHDVLNRPECLLDLLDTFGGDILTPGGLVNRKKLGAIVFNDPELLRKLGEITYPPILDECDLQMTTALGSGFQAVVLDAPTLFESGADGLCDCVVSVVTPRELRLARILVRDGITKEQALDRMKNQFEDEFYTSRSNFVILNDGTLENLQNQVKAFRDFLNLDTTLDKGENEHE